MKVIKHLKIEQMNNKNIKKTISNLALSTSCHGIPNFYKTERILLKIIWLLFIIISFIACVLMVTKSVNDYFQYEVTTKIETIQTNSMTLPEISICIKKGQQKNESIHIYNCKFGLNNNCVTSYTSGDYLEYTCITLNTGLNSSLHPIELIKSDIGGVRNGIEIKMFIPGNDYVNVIITDNKFKPGFNQMDNLAIKKKTKTFLSLKKIVEKKIAEPYSQCRIISDLAIYKEIVNSNKNYTREYCITLCICKIWAEMCFCYCPSFNDNNHYNQSCYSTNSRECRNNGLKSREKDKAFCENLCPSECETTKFELSTQSFAYDEGELIEEQKNFNASSYTNQYTNDSSNILTLQLYFAYLEYTQISQIIKTTVPDLVSIIGGTLGLFLGLSLLSFVEILDFLLEAMYILIDRFKIKQKVTNN